MKATVFVTLKTGVLDPQGQAVQKTLNRLGFAEAESVRIGKYVEINLKGVRSRKEAQKQVEAMCEKLIANTVIEEYRVEIIE